MENKNVARLGVSVVLLAFLAYIADWESILSLVGKADRGLYAASVVLFLTTYVSISYRWMNLMKRIEMDIDLGESFRIISVSYGFNKLFPGNAGDLARSKISERYLEVESHGSILGITAVERYLDLVAVTSIVLVAGVLTASGIIERYYLFFLPFLAVMAGITILMLIHTGRFSFLTRLLPERLQKESERALETLSSFPLSSLIENLSVTYYGWIVEVFVFYLLAISLGMELGIWEAAIVTSMMSLVSALPLSPGGLGTVDATGAGLLVALGFDYPAALSLVILERSIELVLMSLVGFLVYWYDETYSSSLFSL